MRTEYMRKKNSPIKVKDTLAKNTLVKICGVSNAIDAKNAIACGADAIGFVMGGKVLPPEVEPHAQRVREIIKGFPKTGKGSDGERKVDSFIVTHLLLAEDILSLAEYVQSTGIQISEDISMEELKKVRDRTTRKIIKTVVVREGAEEYLKRIEPYCDHILLDTRFAGYTGGTGVTNDWERCKKLVSSAKKPVYLAGGLTPENVKEAICKVKPAGVDISTGVSAYSEEYLRKDRKDPEKIKRFIGIAKGTK